MLSSEQIITYQSEVEKLTLSDKQWQKISQTSKALDYGLTFTELMRYMLEHEKAIIKNNFQKALFIECLFENINYHRELDCLRKCDYEGVAKTYLNN